MSDSDVQITFGADASAVMAAAGDVKASIDAMMASISDMTASLSDLRKLSASAFSGLGDSGKMQADFASNLNLFSQYQGQLVQLNAQGLAQQNADSDKAVAQFKKQWDKAVDPMVASVSRGFVQMAEGSKSFQQVMRQVGEQILNTYVSSVINPMLEKWLWKETGQTTATAMGVTQRTAAEKTGSAQSIAVSGAAGLKSVTNSAAQAAAESYKAMAGIPIVGPALGAAAAAVAFGAVAAYKGLIVSAAGGFDIPSGVNPLTQLHEQEMVLPARLANPLRDMLSNYSPANDVGPASASGGDTHNHYYSINAMDGPSFKGFLRGNADHLSTVLQEMGRRGQKTG